MLLLYNIFIVVYGAAVRLAALWNPKAKEWVLGRRKVFASLEGQISANDKTIWMHCASAGEFEQGKPVIELLKKNYPGHKVVVTFFSPSGYNAGKKYKEADVVSFLPEDTSANAAKFLRMVRPSLAVFVKYDYWYHHLHQAFRQNVPIVLVSAKFRRQQAFFRSWGALHRKMLRFFRLIFVQEEQSRELLRTIGVNNVFIAGDTRFDRVIRIAGESTAIPQVDAFSKDAVTIVAGSTWEQDETLLASVFKQKEQKLVIAPHEISEKNVRRILTAFSFSVRLSEYSADQTDKRVLVIDNYGMLSRLYRYATVCYIGGGFNKSGIHNTLEAAVWSKPVIFGPYYKKFNEAVMLVKEDAAFPVHDENSLKNSLTDLLSNDERLSKSGESAGKYVRENAGASKMIIDQIQEKRLLTT